MMDLISELEEVQAEAPDAHILISVRYPSGSERVKNITDPGEAREYARMIAEGVVTLSGIHAYHEGHALVTRSYPEPEAPEPDQ